MSDQGGTVNADEIELFMTKSREAWAGVTEALKSMPAAIPWDGLPVRWCAAHNAEVARPATSCWKVSSPIRTIGSCVIRRVAEIRFEDSGVTAEEET